MVLIKNVAWLTIKQLNPVLGLRIVVSLAELHAGSSHTQVLH
jgi:hypothetical protein